MKQDTYIFKHALIICTCIFGLLACQNKPIAPPPVPAVKPYSGPTLSIAQGERGVQVFLPSSVLFDSGKSEFNLGDSAPYLDRVAELLKNKTQKKIAIEGHTDNVGAAAANQKLSEQRAANLMAALKERGIPEDRMITAGYAANRPMASNSNEEGRKINRRVEVLILDEKVETLTAGEPANAFNSAFDQLRKMVEAGLIKPPEGSK